MAIKAVEIRTKSVLDIDCDWLTKQHRINQSRICFHVKMGNNIVPSKPFKRNKERESKIYTQLLGWKHSFVWTLLNLSLNGTSRRKLQCLPLPPRRLSERTKTSSKRMTSRVGDVELFSFSYLYLIWQENESRPNLLGSTFVVRVDNKKRNVPHSLYGKVKSWRISRKLIICDIDCLTMNFNCHII